MKLPALLYVYDPLCGWCYGFSPVLKKLRDDFQDKLHFEVLSGGMVMGDRVGPIGQVAPYIKWAYKDVENRTGVQFGEAFLNDVLEPGTAVFSSEKPCIALTVFKSHQPENAVSFAHDLQYAVYHDGKDLTTDETYLNLVAPYGIDGRQFVQQLNSEEFKRKTHQEFKLVSEMGVSGFPTVLLLTEKQNYLLARGYTDYQPLHDTVEKIINN
ncbi:MAG: DsbA family protein [Cytophagales bacterium]|jgi:putative protein-disulfide isomerase|nr:DsbA family protein [Cytophagales bacterium]